MTLLITDPRFQRHDTGPGRPEQPARLRSIDKYLNDSGLIERCMPLPFDAISDDEVNHVHSAGMIATLGHIAAAGGGRADPDTAISSDSQEVAHLASGACCTAVDAVLAGRDRTALCLVRPPGHHATPTHMMGFCLFNNIALAARRAIDKHHVARVLIVDWDVHHGNGTQDVFYADPRVMFLSIHRYGNGFYPGTGARDESGTGPGLGYTRNVPLPFGTPRDGYFDAFTRALEQSADILRPELVLISAGFDAHRNDPIGSLGLDTDDFRRLTELVLQIADVHCQGRVVSCLEGGYNLEALGESVAVHLEGLLAGSA